MGSGLPKPILSKLVERVGSKDVAAACSAINGRRESMEDAHCMVIEDKYMLFGIFDGHSNEKCAIFIASELPKKIKNKFPISDEELVDICISLDEEYIKIDNDGGCTATFIIIEKKKTPEGKYKATIANIGDSRILVVRNNEIIFETKDHKPKDAEERKRIEACGGRVLNKGIDGGLQVSRAFGDGTFKQNVSSVDQNNESSSSNVVDLRNQKVIAVPDITHLEIENEDIILLTCDGVFEGDFDEKDSLKFLESWLPPPEKDYAVTAARGCEIASQYGSKDNISCMIVHMVDGCNYLSKFGPTSFVPGPPYTKKHEPSIKAYTQMAELGKTNLKNALKQRYKLYQDYLNKKIQNYDPIYKNEFKSYDDSDKGESEFWGERAKGQDLDEYINRLIQESQPDVK